MTAGMCLSADEIAPREEYTQFKIPQKALDMYRKLRQMLKIIFLWSELKNSWFLRNSILISDCISENKAIFRFLKGVEFYFGTLV